MLGKTRSSAVSAAEAQQKIGTIIGPGAVFNGDLTAPETMQISGYIYGNCTCDKNVVLGPEGQIQGNLSAQNIFISGKIEGDVTAMEKLEILSTGKVLGNISAKSLVVDENAWFDGRCIMTSGDTAGQQPRISAKNPMEPVDIPPSEPDAQNTSNKKK